MTRFHVHARRRTLLALGAVLLATGCGRARTESPNREVAGKVVIPASPIDTQRLEGGKVRFRSVTDPGWESVGVIDHDGTFAMGTRQAAGPARAGVPVGEYVVRIEPAADDRREPRPAPFHAKYRDYRTSPLRVTVPPAGEVTFELDPARR